MIVNGCIDRLVQWPAYPTMAYNNTYGIQAVNESQYLNMTDSFERPGACKDQIIECRELAAVGDPQNLGVNETVNEVCQAAESFCRSYVLNPYILYSGLSKDMKEVYALLQTGTARGKLLAEQVRYSPMTEPMNVLISQICSFVPSTVASSPFVLTLLRMSARGHVELKPTT